MLKIYHQEHLHNAQRRRLWSVFAMGLLLGSILAFGGRSVDVISPAYASGATSPAPQGRADAERQAPVALKFSSTLQTLPH